MEATDTAKNGSTTAPNNGSSGGKQPQDKVKKARKTVGIPTIGALTSMISVVYTGRVSKEPTPWERIENYEFFSPSSDGSRLMMRISCSKSIDLLTRKTIPTSYGQGYIVHMDAHPSKPDF